MYELCPPASKRRAPWSKIVTTSLLVVGSLVIAPAVSHADGGLIGTTNSIVNIDCSIRGWDSTETLRIAPGTAVDINVSNCTQASPGEGVETLTALTHYSISATASEDMSISVSSAEVNEGDPIDITFVRLTTDNLVPSPSGVLTLTDTATIPIRDTKTFYTNKSVEDSGLAGNTDCQLATGDHPYSTTKVTITTAGDYTFRIAGVDPVPYFLGYQGAGKSPTLQPGDLPISDPFLAVYSSFDSANPETGIVGCNDDSDSYAAAADAEDEGVAYVAPNVLVENSFSSFSAYFTPGNYTLVLTTYDPFSAAEFAASGLDQSALYEMWGPQGGVVAYTPPQPTVDLTLTVAVGAPVAGGEVSISGSALKSLSGYNVVLRSAPQIVNSGTTLQDGSFSGAFVMPTGLEPGQHTLTLNGEAPDGSALSRVAYFTIASDGTLSYISTTSAQVVLPTVSG